METSATRIMAEAAFRVRDQWRAVQRYAHGWSVFFYLLRGQRRKRHGTGPRRLIQATYFAQCGRFVAAGQHRAGPNLTRYYALAVLVGEIKP